MRRLAAREAVRYVAGLRRWSPAFALAVATFASAAPAWAQRGKPAPPAPAPDPGPPPPSAATAEEVAALREALARMRADLEAQAKEAADRADAADLRAAGAERAAAEAHLRADEVAAALDVERARGDARDRAAAEAPTAVLVSAGRVKIGLGLFVQVDSVIHDQASADELDPGTGAPLNQDRVLLRRGRLRVDVDSGVVGAVLELDANTINGAQTRVIGAEISAKMKRSELSLEGVAGLFRIPFGLETRQTYRDRLFLEPGNAVRALFPGDYDLGLQVRSSWRWLRAQVAVMNGEPSGSRTFPLRDAHHGKEIVGRVAVAVGRTASKPGRLVDERGVGVEVGMSATSGDGLHAGEPSTKDTLVWRDANEDGTVQLSELQVIAGATATPSEAFARFAIGADVRVIAGLGRWGEVVAYGEVIQAENLDRGMFVADPVASGRDVRELGIMAGVTWDARWGGQVGVRYDRYDPDADAFEQQAGDVIPRDPVVSTLAVAAGWRLRGRGRALLEYDHERNPFGRDAGAEPTTRASDSLTLRLEATF